MQPAQDAIVYIVDDDASADLWATVAALPNNTDSIVPSGSYRTSSAGINLSDHGGCSTSLRLGSSPSSAASAICITRLLIMFPPSLCTFFAESAHVIRARFYAAYVFMRRIGL